MKKVKIRYVECRYVTREVKIADEVYNRLYSGDDNIEFKAFEELEEKFKNEIEKNLNVEMKEDSFSVNEHCH